MDTTRKILMVLAVAQCLAVFVQAEYRPWSDIKGNTIEAEYIRTSDETVVLRKRDGTEIKVPLLSLSEQDRTYAMLQCPPEIEISMDDRLDRETLDYRGGRPGLRHYRQESVTIDVSLNKTSTEWYDAELSLEICLLGWMEQMNRYVIVGKIDSKFRFSDENKGLFTSTSRPFGQVPTAAIRLLPQRPAGLNTAGMPKPCCRHSRAVCLTRTLS